MQQALILMSTCMKSICMHATEPIYFVVIFDPASFYGHSEFDLAIAQMFGGFSTAFFEHYHKVIPRAAGFRKRSDLYKLFHYLNHWLVVYYTTING